MRNTRLCLIIIINKTNKRKTKSIDDTIDRKVG